MPKTCALNWTNAPSESVIKLKNEQNKIKFELFSTQGSKHGTDRTQKNRAKGKRAQMDKQIKIIRCYSSIHSKTSYFVFFCWVCSFVVLGLDTPSIPA